jgi:hypothetical protein
VFALDSEVVRLPSWPSARGTVVADAKFEALYVLGDGRVDVVAHPGSRRVRAGAMRVVREIATARALGEIDCLQLHAAAVERDGRALLLAGPKATGKTTLLAYLATTERVRILANDRVLLRGSADALEVRGVPTVVSVRPDTAALVPRLADSVPAVDSPAHLTLAETEAALAAHGAVPAGRRLRLAPSALARLLGAPLVAAARVVAIALPVLDPGREGLDIERLPVAEAERRLGGARFGVHSGKAGPTVFERLTGTRRPAAVDATLLAGLAAAVPCLAVRVGTEELPRAEAAASILAAAGIGA